MPISGRKRRERPAHAGGAQAALDMFVVHVLRVCKPDKGVIVTGAIEEEDAGRQGEADEQFDEIESTTALGLGHGSFVLSRPAVGAPVTRRRRRAAARAAAAWSPGRGWSQFR